MSGESHDRRGRPEAERASEDVQAHLFGEGDRPVLENPLGFPEFPGWKWSKHRGCYIIYVSLLEGMSLGKPTRWRGGTFTQHMKHWDRTRKKTCDMRVKQLVLGSLMLTFEYFWYFLPKWESESWPSFKRAVFRDSPGPFDLRFDGTLGLSQSVEYLASHYRKLQSGEYSYAAMPAMHHFSSFGTVLYILRWSQMAWRKWLLQIAWVIYVLQICAPWSNSASPCCVIRHGRSGVFTVA